MDETQYARWREFSERMAAGFPNVTEARRGRLREEVGNYFGWLDDGGGWRDMTRWDDSKGEYACDLAAQGFDHYAACGGRYAFRRDECSACDFHARFYRQLCCCLRAGIDAATDGPGGVLGFTLGDLRAFWPEGIPAWVSGGYETDLAGGGDGEGIWL